MTYFVIFVIGDVEEEEKLWGRKYIWRINR